MNNGDDHTNLIKKAYRIGLENAIEEIKENGFDSIWNDNQRVASGDITIHFAPNEIVSVTYSKIVRPKVMTHIPDLSADV